MNVLTRALGLFAASVFCSLLIVPLAHGQTITINEARNQGVDSTVTVEGTVTRAYGDFVRFQDDSGPTGASGLVVRKTGGSFHDDIESDTIRQGTQLQVTGTLSEFNGLLQINEDDLNSYTVQGQGTLPDSQDVTLSTLRADGENYESELVRITGLDFVTATGTFSNETSYTVSDESGTATFEQGTATFRVQDNGETALAGEAIPEGAFDYTGVVGEFSGQYQLIPVRPGDVQPATSFGFGRPFVQAEEGSGTVQVAVKPYATGRETVSMTARVGGESTATNGTDVTGFTSPQTLTFSGSDPSPQTLSFTVAEDSEQEGVERLEVVLESDDGVLTQAQRFTLWILDSPAAQAPIAEGGSGDALIDSLQQRYGDPRPLGYDLARDSMYARIYNGEADTVEGKYSGYKITVDPTQGDPSAIAANKGINTEHTWPQSKGAGQEPARSNLHILIPTRAEVNSARSNLPYGESPDAETDQWFFEDQVQMDPPSTDRPLWSELLNNQNFEPRHSVKGDVARAAFYFVTVYPNRADFSFFEAQRDTLLAWHEQDPVDATEMRRTLFQASYQDNALNPFVVDSTLVDRAYGSGADEDDDPPPTTATFELFADQSDLTPPSGQTDAQCLVQLSSGNLLFFNSEDGGIFTWDGSSLSVHRSAQDLNSDISPESNNIDRCDGVAVANDVVYFLFRSSATNDNYVYRTEAANPDENSFEQFNGANGVAAGGSTVYLSAISNFGAPANGIFEISADLSGSPTELASNEDVSPGTIDVLGGTLYGYSNDFGNGDFNRTLFSLEVTASSPSFQVLASPFGVGSPLNGGNPENEDVSGIQDVKAISFGGNEFVVVHNQNSTAPEGEEFGTIRVSDQAINRLFTATDLTSNLSVSNFSAAFSRTLSANGQGEVFVASGAFGPDYIAKVSDAPPLPVELTRFDAVQSGSSVELTWRTASETNNARFEVERKGEWESGGEEESGDGWEQIGVVEGGGTTEGARTYQFTDATLPFGPEALTYRLRQVDLDGSVSYSEPATVQRTVEEVALRAPFPNPVRRQATVPFAVPGQQDVTLHLYDVLGRRVKTIVDGPQSGRQQVQVDLSGLSSGVYFLRLRTDGQTRTTRLTVMQ